MKLLRPSAGHRKGGFSLVEVMISSTIFLLVSGAVVTTLLVTTALNSTNRETMLAFEAAQSVVESLKVVEFGEVFARYNATAADDPAAGTSPGNGFAVEGLALQEGDADGFAGAVEFPGNGVELREDDFDEPLGMPRDLDGDGPPFDALNHALDSQILPVRVVVAWRGKNGPRTLELVTVLAEQ